MEFIAKINNLPTILGFLIEQAKSAGIMGERLGKITLASEEALVNVIYHAYSESDSEENLLNLTCEFFEPNEFRITLRDSGKPFDPTKKEVDLQTGVPVEERIVGGLGIHMIRQLVDAIQYERINDENILTLTFRK